MRLKTSKNSVRLCRLSKQKLDYNKSDKSLVCFGKNERSNSVLSGVAVFFLISLGSNFDSSGTRITVPK